VSTGVERDVPDLNHALQAMNALRALSKTTSILGMGKKVLKDPGGSSSSAAFAEDYSGGNEAEGQEGGTRRASLWGKAQVGHFLRLGMPRHANPLITSPHKCCHHILWALGTRCSCWAD
jgi:hypothetical protein